MDGSANRVDNSPEADESRNFYFCDGIFGQLIGGTFVILNLNEGRYLQIDLSDKRILLNGLQQGLNTPEKDSAFDGAIWLTGKQYREVRPQIDALIEKGLLSPNRGNNNLPGTAEPVDITRDFSGNSERVSKITITERSAFWLATSISDFRLRFQKLKRIISRFQDRAQQCNLSDEHAALRAWRAFSTLRPFYPRPASCLFDSLAAATFFQMRDIRVTWTFGVKLQPFAAHCWLEHGDAIVNDSVDSINRFTRIMRV